MEVVKCEWPLSASPGPPCGKVGLVGGGIIGEAYVAVDAVDEVLGGELGDGVVNGDYFLVEGFDKRVPILEGAAELWVVRYGWAGGWVSMLFTLRYYEREQRYKEQLRGGEGGGGEWAIVFVVVVVVIDVM